MYQPLVRRRVRVMFAAVSAGEVDRILAAMAPDVEHRFAGDHPLGGVRVGTAAVGAWFERLGRLFPAVAFEIGEVAVSGPPWNLRVTVEWVADVTPLAGEPYRNRGAHLIHLVRGKVVSFHAYEDSQAVAAACAVMAAAGIEEAAAAPIEGRL